MRRDWQEPDLKRQPPLRLISKLKPNLEPSSRPSPRKENKERKK